MSDEVQERVEDYLGLERYIEQLRLQRSARLPDNLAPQQTRIYGMALFFHTALPHVADPRPEFVAELGQRLREQAEGQSSDPVSTNSADRGKPSPYESQDKGQFRTIFKQDLASQPTHILPHIHAENIDEKKGTRQDRGKRRTRFSRRRLATLAAEILVAAGIGA